MTANIVTKRQFWWLQALNDVYSIKQELHFTSAILQLNELWLFNMKKQMNDDMKIDSYLILLAKTNILLCKPKKLNKWKKWMTLNQNWVLYSSVNSIEDPTKLDYIDTISKCECISFLIAKFQYSRSLESKIKSVIIFTVTNYN